MLVQIYELSPPDGYTIIESGGDGFSCVNAVERLGVIVSWGMNWDHVSVSNTKGNKRKKTPTWEQMNRVKRAFFRYDETVVQYHPAVDEHVSPGSALQVEVLHLWRPHLEQIPTPPVFMV